MNTLRPFLFALAAGLITFALSGGTTFLSYSISYPLASGIMFAVFAISRRQNMHTKTKTPTTLPIPDGYHILPSGARIQEGDLCYNIFTKKFFPSTVVGWSTAKDLCYIRPDKNNTLRTLDARSLAWRIKAYLTGGVFNPELADKLLHNCHAYLEQEHK